MFEEIFKRQLYKLFVLNPNLKSVLTEANAWNESVVKSWGDSEQEVEYIKQLISKDIRLLLQTHKLKIKAYLSEMKSLFQTEFPKSGIQILTEAHENQPTSIGEQALDGIARLLLSKFPDSGCVCVCVHPIYSCLVIASNTCEFDAQMATIALNDLAAMAKIEVEALENSDQTRIDLVAEVRPEWEKRGPKLNPELLEKRLKLDRLKYFQQLENIAKLPIRVPTYRGVHADIQLLEYIEVSLRRTAMRTVPMYLGDAMRCCAKCETLIREYNSCGFNKVQVKRRGYHSTYDFSNWTCPPTIRDVVTNSGQRKNIDKAILALIFAEKTSKDSMYADLSDDEQ